MGQDTPWAHAHDTAFHLPSHLSLRFATELWPLQAHIIFVCNKWKQLQQHFGTYHLHSTPYRFKGMCTISYVLFSQSSAWSSAAFVVSSLHLHRLAARVWRLALFAVSFWCCSHRIVLDLFEQWCTCFRPAAFEWDHVMHWSRSACTSYPRSKLGT